MPNPATVAPFTATTNGTVVAPGTIQGKFLRDDNTFQTPAGVTGPAGPAGAVGATGPAGVAGTPGAVGATGPKGATGSAGVAGSPGAAGPVGPVGSTGPTGAQGIQGIPGSGGGTGTAYARNVKDFGAKGDGFTDDRAAIQACFDAAFGPVGSEHAEANKFLNTAVYFPAGDYQVSSPLYLNKVAGCRVFGDGENCTRLNYTGTATGNTVAQGNLSAADWAAAKAITPLLMMNGWGYAEMSGLGFRMPANVAGSCCLWLFWNGTGGGGVGPTNDTWTNLLFDGGNAGNNGGAVGFLIGYLSVGLCSEQMLISCSATQCSWGFRIVSANSLNIQFHNVAASYCTVAGVSAPTGHFNMFGGSFANNSNFPGAKDIELGGAQTFLIQGVRSESTSFLDMTAGESEAHVVSCRMATTTGAAGYFVQLANGSHVVLDNCWAEDTRAGTGMLQGTNGYVALRQCNFANPGFLNLGSGCHITEYTPVGVTTFAVAKLPPAALCTGLRLAVGDGVMGAFGAPLSGDGNSVLPTYCDGAMWRIG